MANKFDKDIVPYEESLELKNLGFNLPCFGAYVNGEFVFAASDEGENVLAPTFSQAMRWFRDIHDQHAFVGYIFRKKKFTGHTYSLTLTLNEYMEIRPFEELRKDSHVDTFEEIELICLRKLINTIKLSKNGK